MGGTGETARASRAAGRSRRKRAAGARGGAVPALGDIYALVVLFIGFVLWEQISDLKNTFW